MLGKVPAGTMKHQIFQSHLTVPGKVQIEVNILSSLVNTFCVSQNTPDDRFLLFLINFKLIDPKTLTAHQTEES